MSINKRFMIEDVDKAIDLIQNYLHESNLMNTEGKELNSMLDELWNDDVGNILSRLKDARNGAMWLMNGELLADGSEFKSKKVEVC